MSLTDRRRGIAYKEKQNNRFSVIVLVNDSSQASCPEKCTSTLTINYKENKELS